MSPFKSYFKYFSLLRKGRWKKGRDRNIWKHLNKVKYIFPLSPSMFYIDIAVLSFKSRGVLPPVLIKNVRRPAHLRKKKKMTKGFEWYWLLTEIKKIWEDILPRAGSDMLFQQSLLWGKGLWCWTILSPLTSHLSLVPSSLPI